MSRTDVQEMVTLCKSLGLAVQFETGSTHYSVRDPVSSAKLFYISNTPSDTNFKYEIARHLRRLGLLKGNLKFGKFQTISRKKKFGAIDLAALRKAQEAAESAGERIPLLEDIDGQTEFFRQTKINNVSHGFTKAAQQEAIDNMAMKLSPRGNVTKQRLRKFYDEHPNFTDAEFVRAAITVGNNRGLRVWPSLNAGQSAIGQFKNDDDKTMQIWGMNLVEATLDHLEGMRFDTEPPVSPEPEVKERTGVHIEGTEVEYITETTLGNILENFKVQIINEMQTHLQERVNDEVNGGDNLRERYAETLLTLLASNPAELDLLSVLDRLDKLVGL